MTEPAATAPGPDLTSGQVLQTLGLRPSDLDNPAVTLQPGTLQALLQEIARAQPFDAAFYAETYPDVHAAWLRGEVADLHSHFVTAGFIEGRLPHAAPAVRPQAKGAAVFTIVSANYIAFAATLMQSVREHHPELRRIIVLSDAAHAFEGLDLAAELITCDDLGIALIENMKLWYSVIEFNTAVKPFVFRHLFAEGHGQAVYLDPDIQLFSPLTEVFAGLEDHSLVLTPHMTEPLQDGRMPDDHFIMKAGVYNLGFAGVANDAEGAALVAWWCDRLFAHCRNDVRNNYFTDQRWMDLAPAFVSRPLLLRHPGYNVAYWNLVHRPVTRTEAGRWLAGGEKLAFFHFSGIVPTDASVFSKHQDRFTVDTLGPVAGLCDSYRERVLANGWLRFNRIPYAFGTFADGRVIADAMRHWTMRAIDSGVLAADRPLRLNAAFFDDADPAVGVGRITRFAYQYWMDRTDLVAAFDLTRQEGLDGFLDWFCGGSAAREGVDPASIAAASRVRGGPVDLPPVPAATATAAPWPPMASESWAGPAREVETWLSGDLEVQFGPDTVLLPRQAALLWEQRLDLQKYFDVGRADGLWAFVAWALTDGMQQGALLPELLSDGFTRWMATPDAAQNAYGDVPVTLGMGLTSRSGHRRHQMTHWMHFPVTRLSRVEQGLWYAFVAPDEFGWPDAAVAEVRRFFQQPSALSIGGFPLSAGLHAIWEMRDDLHAAFPLDTEQSRAHYLVWFVVQGSIELRIDPLLVCPGIDAFLGQPWPGRLGLRRRDQLIRLYRTDLQDAFDLDTPDGVAGFQHWVRTDPDSFVGRFTARLQPHARPAPAPVVRAAVALSGDWSVPSGIGEEVRCSAVALDAVGFRDYLVVDLRTGQVLRPDGTVLPDGCRVEVGCNIVHHNADTALEDWRRLRALGVSAGRIVGHWNWELERLPSWAAHAYSFYDEIWANTRFALDAFEAPNRRGVRLLGGTVATPTPSGLSRAELGLLPGRTVFLFMFDFHSWTSRKNPQAVIQAFLAAFPAGTEPVQLVIKTQNGASKPELFEALSNLASDGRIILLDRQMSRDDVSALVAHCDAFVSLHRSEGYGRGPLEAMLLGRTVIMTGYSGTNDYADDTTARLVDYTLVPVRPDEYPGVEHQRWADADTGEAAEAMAWVLADPAGARAMGERARAHIRALLAPERVGEAMLRALSLAEPALS